MWFITNLDRLNKERQKITNLESCSPWLDILEWNYLDGLLYVDCDITHNEKRITFRLTFPEIYPDAPPSVCPLNKEVISSHQYGIGGELCLEIGPDNWHPDSFNASMLLQSAYKLITLEASNKKIKKTEIPSRHQVTLGQEARNKIFRFALTPEAKEALNGLAQTSPTSIDVRFVYHDKSIVMHLISIGEENTEKWVDPTPPDELKHITHINKGVAIALNADKSTIDNFSDFKTVSEYIASVADDEKSAKKILVVKDDVGEWHAFWAVGESLATFKTIEIDVTSVSERSGIDPSLLDGKLVSIIGLGSIGSKIAVSLCRSGIQNFYLIDDDLFFPSNIARHECDWRDVAQHKVDAISERLRLINPQVNVFTRSHRLAGQESTLSASSALAKLKNSDLLIDATANNKVFNVCAHVAKRAKIPIIWAEVFAGGIGGLVARAIPSIDADPFSTRQAVIDFFADKNYEPQSQTNDYSSTDSSGQVHIASDAEVSTIAAYSAQISLDILLEQGTPKFPHPIYIVGFKKCSIFQQPFETHPVTCTSKGQWGEDKVADSSAIVENTEFLINVLKKKDNDNTLSTEDSS